VPVAESGDTATQAVTVTEATIDDYAAVTGDDNPLHLDAEYAADGLFGGRVAHGMFTAGVVSAALAALPGDVVYDSQELSFEATRSLPRWRSSSNWTATDCASTPSPRPRRRRC